MVKTSIEFKRPQIAPYGSAARGIRYADHIEILPDSEAESRLLASIVLLKFFEKLGMEADIIACGGNTLGTEHPNAYYYAQYLEKKGVNPARIKLVSDSLTSIGDADGAILQAGGPKNLWFVSGDRHTAGRKLAHKRGSKFISSERIARFYATDEEKAEILEKISHPTPIQMAIQKFGSLAITLGQERTYEALARATSRLRT